ncbi:hypothetical protein [Nocardioides soli]|uniref:Uncharacterized protein n=1 Tax=Nocardioides soli TaxID=1036020 RepID=A0A7W4VSW8_9ACTN|nr:hypothetical protein [Nocardioides soli]MBB3041181.1 hypothetical protein [Nocardioides soli]
MYDHTDLGVDLIRAERERQIVDEGYTPDHDRAHSHSDLLDAALAYIKVQPHLWPWHLSTFKPAHDEPHDDCDDRCIRDLVKAGALIAAAIDRLLDDQKDS